MKYNLTFPLRQKGPSSFSRFKLIQKPFQKQSCRNLLHLLMATPEERAALSLKIAKVFDDVRTSHAVHIRRLKELAALRSSAPAEFCSAFCEALTPLFNFQRRTSSAERIIKFASVFTCSRGGKDHSADEFLEKFLKFLLVAAAAANKTARFRACQIVSEVC